MSDRFSELSESDFKYEKKLNDRMIKQLLNLAMIIAKLLATDKSRYFAKPLPIIVNYQ